MPIGRSRGQGRGGPAGVRPEAGRNPGADPTAKPGPPEGQVIDDHRCNVQVGVPAQSQRFVGLERRRKCYG